MSKSGSKYRDPFTIAARKRKGAPHEPEKRHMVEELRQKELDDELQDMLHDEQEWTKKSLEN